MKTKENDSLGDRMKFFESQTSPKLTGLVPVIARLDGKNFHSFTKGLNRPFDRRLSDLMVETTAKLVEETGACCGYTQSDEISLIMFSSAYKSKIYFDGKLQKISSVLAAKASVYFNSKLPKCIPEKADKEPVFDCRTFWVPTQEEAVNCLIWREQDATRNSIQMAARAYFSHAQCNGLNCDELQEELWRKKNINWNDYPDFFKRGTMVRKIETTRKFTCEEIEELPKHHKARKDPNLTVSRKDIFVDIGRPPLTQITNRVEYVFNGGSAVV